MGTKSNQGNISKLHHMDEKTDNLVSAAEQE
jgi:hypothetical protein